MNDWLCKVLDEFKTQLFQFFCDPLTEADVVAHLYHLWHKTGATRGGWPHVNARLEGLKPLEHVDFAVGSVKEKRGRRRLEPTLIVEVKVLLKDFRPQAIQTRIRKLKERDLAKLACIASSTQPEKYLLIVDEWGYFLPNPTTGGREKLTELVNYRERSAPGVGIVLFEKQDSNTIWTLY